MRASPDVKALPDPAIQGNRNPQRERSAARLGFRDRRGTCGRLVWSTSRRVTFAGWATRGGSGRLQVDRRCGWDVAELPGRQVRHNYGVLTWSLGRRLGIREGSTRSPSISPLAWMLNSHLPIPSTFIYRCTGDATFLAAQEAVPVRLNGCWV